MKKSLGVLLLAAAACAPRGPDPTGRVLRVGHFPNVTHAQGLVAHALSRRGEGWFEGRLGGVQIQWFVYNAGPSAMEAILGGSLDLAYVGPTPALNAHLRSDGEEVRILAGAAVGGAALLVQGDGRIRAEADFRGRKVATPQFGNTQDVACRAWLAEKGFDVRPTGGDVLVLPTENPEHLLLFQRGEIDAAWTVEPWVSRLEREANARVFLEEREALTTLLVSSARLMEMGEERARAFARAHEELTAWIGAHPEEARRLIGEELKAETGREIPAALIEKSWSRLRFTSEAPGTALGRHVSAAQRIGFLPEQVDLSRLGGTP